VLSAIPIYPDFAYPFLVAFGSFGMFLGLLMSGGQLIVSRKNALNYYLAALFFLLSGMLFYFHSIRVGWLFRNPEWFSSLLVFVFFVGPVLRRIGLHVLEDNGSSKSPWIPEWLHYIPGSLCILFLIGDQFRPGDKLRQNLEQVLFGDSTGIWDILLFTSLFFLTGYIIQITILVSRLFRWEAFRSKYVSFILLFLVISAIGNSGLGFLFLVNKSIWILEFASLAMTSCLVIAYLIGHRYPEFFQRLQEAAVEEKVKYAKSQLEGLDLDALRENLETLMRKDKLYREEDLSLSDLAEELALSNHQISQFLNQHLGKNFSQFLHEYRIREAQEFLVQDPDRSILDIAYSVGYANKSSFHRAFFKQTGLSPSEWRTRNLPDSQKNL
jgi:AraC-like DNA-binding protein